MSSEQDMSREEAISNLREFLRSLGSSEEVRILKLMDLSDEGWAESLKILGV